MTTSLGHHNHRLQRRRKPEIVEEWPEIVEECFEPELHGYYYNIGEHYWMGRGEVQLHNVWARVEEIPLTLVGMQMKAAPFGLKVAGVWLTEGGYVVSDALFVALDFAAVVAAGAAAGLTVDRDVAAVEDIVELLVSPLFLLMMSGAKP